MNNERLVKLKEIWREKRVIPLLKKFPERKQQFKTSSESEIDTLYTPIDLDSVDYEEDLGFPGQYPFTRGVQSTMYRRRL